MSMSPDVCMSKNTEDEINELQERIEELDAKALKVILPEVQELQEQNTALLTINDHNTKEIKRLNELAFNQYSAISYLEDKLIEALEDADKGWDRAREIAVELANSIKTIEKYKQLFDETNAVFKKLGI